MQKEISVLDNEPVQFKIQANWDVEDAVNFTKELYDSTNKGIISFELNARKGSLSTDFVITILTGVASAFLYDIIKFIFKLLKRDKDNNREIKPVYIFTDKEEFIITGDNKSKIPDKLKEELFKD